MPDWMKAFVLGPGAGPSVRNPVGGELTFKLRGEQSDGAMTVIETEAAPNEGPPLHVHELEDEWVYVLTGEMRIRIGDEVVPAPAGTFAFIPRGVAHTWQNIGGMPAVMLGVITPSALERFFERYAKLPAEEANLDSFGALARDAGMTVAGPPLARSHPAQ